MCWPNSLRILISYRKVSIRKQFFTRFNIKKSHCWIDIFIHPPCKKQFSDLYRSILEHNLENKYVASNSRYWSWSLTKTRTWTFTIFFGLYNSLLVSASNLEYLPLGNTENPEEKTRVFFPNSPTFLTLNVRNSIDREKNSKETWLLPTSCLERKTKNLVDIFLNTRVITFAFYTYYPFT